MISSYGDQSTAENNPSYYYRILLAIIIQMLPEHLICSIHAITTSG